MLEIWTDGGVILRNPSEIGGTWSWVLTEDDEFVEKSSGILMPEDINRKVVTNNVTELYAALKALQRFPDFSGVLNTDSMVTLKRLTGSWSFKGVPSILKYRCKKLRHEPKWKVRLVGGHPTKVDLLRGVNGKGATVSRWNVLCDELCKTRAQEFLKENTCQVR